MRDHGKNVYKAFHASMVALAAYRESLKAATKVPSLFTHSCCLVAPLVLILSFPISN